MLDRVIHLADGWLAGALLVAVVVAVTIFLALGGRRFRVVTRRLRCPVHGREALVQLLVEAGDGVVYRDVVACSLEPSVTCDKVCRSLSVAPFAQPPPAA
jgi:hypothetical protein